MRLRIASDLHFEFQRDKGRSLAKEITKDQNFDVLVIAGDLSSNAGLTYSINLLLEIEPVKPILFISGNHEFYGAAFNEGHHENMADFDMAAYEPNGWTSTRRNFHWLSNSILEHDSRRFVGTTLWFPHEPSLDDYNLNDFHLIKNFKPSQMAMKSRLFLESNLQPEDVVITHHLPHPKSTAAIYRNSPLNKFFVHNVANLVENGKAKLWIHGHTHTSMDYVCNGTRVVCNPFGYVGTGNPYEPNPKFDPSFTVEI